MAGLRRSATVVLATIFAAATLTLSQSFAFVPPTASSRSVIRSYNNERQLTRVQYQSSTRESCEARQLTMKKRRGGAGNSSVQQIITALDTELPGIEKDEKKVMISKLDGSWTEEEIKEFASTAGKVVSIRYIQKKNSHTKPRGFAFVEFDEAETAATAIQKLRFTPFNGKAVQVKAAYEDQKEGRARVLAYEKAHPEKVAEIRALLRAPLDLETLGV